MWTRAGDENTMFAISFSELLPITEGKAAPVLHPYVRATDRHTTHQASDALPDDERNIRSWPRCLCTCREGTKD